MESEYMHWAKTRSQARFNLATSNVRNTKLEQLTISIDDLEITGDSRYGYEPLQQLLAARAGVDCESIVAATGTSLANHLAMAAIVSPGDEVLIEKPTYEPLIAVARYLGAEIKRFERPFETGFRILKDEIEGQVSSRTRLIVITNLHNPSGVLTDEETLRHLGEIARSVKAHVLVDEVYLDTVFENTPSTAFHLGAEFITTSSLTKVYGLSGLRCGWIVAEPDIARRIWRLNDLLGSVAAHPAERLSVVALRQLDRIRNAARTLLENNHELVNRFLDTRDDLETVRPGLGTIVFPRVSRGSADGLCQLLREKYETSVAPGRFFEMPEHFRLGLGGDSETLVEGLERLGYALDELRPK
ncbi:MAG TPA: pyridoxal phosphate-dependent aminotransferase [Pyrinomonadaceae bacterium]|nr:pyridoxal phosphate-dependent aminotransferase [Pyrinomonadaceae bacterium]